MKTTLLPVAGTGANRVSCVKISRIKREIHASPKHENTGSLANFTGMAIATGSSMKTIIQNLLAAMLFLAVSLQIHAQGTLIDQESASAPVYIQGNGNVDGLDIQGDVLSQSFTPTFDAIDFVSFQFVDTAGSSGKGATVYFNLYEGGPLVELDTLLGTTSSVYMSNTFGDEGVPGVSTFDFSTPVSLTPGDTYYLEPVVASGDNPFYIITIPDTYPNGRLYSFGDAFNSDAWFQEGIYAVPEPTTLALIGFALLAFFFRKRFKLPIIVFASALLTIPVT